jgi:hypothetical protein
VVIVGDRPPKQAVSLADIVTREVDLVLTYRHDHALEALNFLAEGKGRPGNIDLSSLLVTRTVKGFESIPDAFQFALAKCNGEDTKVKVDAKGIYRLRIEL